MPVVDQESQPGPRHRHAETGQGRVTVLTPQHQLQRHAGEHKSAATAGQAIQAIGEVGGVAFGQKHEQPQGPDQQPERQTPAEGQAHALLDPALPGGQPQKHHCRQALQQQLSPRCEACVGLLREAAPIVEPPDHHVGEGDRRNGEQLLGRRAFQADQTADDRSHRNNEQPSHRWGAGFGQVRLGSFLANHLTHLQGPQTGNAGSSHQGCHCSGDEQGQRQLTVRHPFVEHQAGGQDGQHQHGSTGRAVLPPVAGTVAGVGHGAEAGALGP